MSLSDKSVIKDLKSVATRDYRRFNFVNFLYHLTTVDSRYLEHRAISNKTLGPSSINSSGITTRYLELPAISNFLPGPMRVRDSGSRLYIYSCPPIFRTLDFSNSPIFRTILSVPWICLNKLL